METNSQNNKDRYFKGQYADEEVITFFRCHWLSLLPDFVMYLVFSAICGFVWFNISIIGANPGLKPYFEVMLVVLVVGMSFFFHHIFVNLINHFLETVIITDFRIVEIKKTIILKDTHDSFNMEMIQDIGKEQVGIWKNILRFGDIVIHLASNETKTIKFVPNPDYHFRLMNRIKKEHMQRREREVHTSTANEAIKQHADYETKRQESSTQNQQNPDKLA